MNKISAQMNCMINQIKNMEQMQNSKRYDEFYS